VGPGELSYTQGLSAAMAIKSHKGLECGHENLVTQGLSWAKGIELHTGVECSQRN
jgi:hypothetical protein